jgi:hypothetical protein
MDTTIKIETDMVTVIRRKDELIAIIVRDATTRKALTYMIKDAKVEDIAKLISNNNEE